MKRELVRIRPNWENRCKEVGFDFFDLPSSDGKPYWTEGAAYRFIEAEIDALENATSSLHQMCLSLVGDIISRGDYPAQYNLSDEAKTLIEASWRAKEPSLYGRFDLAYDGSTVKMLEYNADTPTSLLEASVAQWHWLEDLGLPDQFNSIHEHLIEQWKKIGQSIAVMPRIYFSGSELGAREDWGTIEYLMDVAVQAGIEVSSIPIEQIGWDAEKRAFVDANEKLMMACFKLYPWEWLMSDDNGEKISSSDIRFIEPAWKMLLSSKALLPLLWDRHEGHPLLLPAYFDTVTNRPSWGKWALKPILSREGANVSQINCGKMESPSGSNFNPFYEKTGHVIQQWMDIPAFDGFHPVIGSWIIGEESAGIGIREDKGDVTGNNSHFVPHYFTE